MVVSIAIFFAFLSILWQWLALKICLCVFVFTKSIIGTDFLTLFSLNLLNSYWCKLEVENQPCPCLLRSFTFNMCTYLYSVTYLSTDSTCMCVFSAGGGGGGLLALVHLWMRHVCFLPVFQVLIFSFLIGKSYT